jgi:inhibitor of KinA sporulation pathway (predicted exonuclease)
MIKNIYNSTVVAEFKERIDKLTPKTQPLWGKMDVAQMLAHCNVSYEMVYEQHHKAPNPFVKFLLKAFVKKTVVGNELYKKNSSTAPAFIINGTKDFEIEKKRLKDYLNKVLQDGEHYFEGKESLSFGKLSSKEWNNLFYKHLHHHLTQFGV